MKKQNFKIPPIELEWSKWFSWQILEIDARRKGGVRIPNRKPGVYEVKKRTAGKFLVLGKSKDLRKAIKECIIRGRGKDERPHSARSDIKKNNENFINIVIRWAETDRPDAAAEELLKIHKEQHGSLPKYYKKNWVEDQDKK